MKLESVFLMVFLIILVASSSTALGVQRVEASGTIYIRADGSIDPLDAPLSTFDNVTYTLTGNITSDVGGIVIEKDSIVVDGQGYAVQGTWRGTGMTVSGRSNVTVKNTEITAFAFGIWLGYSSNNSISRNNITNNGEGIWLGESSDSIISGNNITDNKYIGIDIDSSSNNTFSGNNVTANNGVGIVLETYSDNNTLSGNNIANNYDGIAFDSNSGNTLSGNNVTANTNYDIFLNSSSNNVFSGNNITNSEYGTGFSASSNNVIFRNNFVNNTNQVSTEFSANSWDDGGTGNYWSDYLTKYPNAAQVDSSGVWNTPYVIDTNNTDHYPLMVQYVIPEFPSFLILPLFFMATLLAVITYRRKQRAHSHFHTVYPSTKVILRHVYSKSAIHFISHSLTS